MNLQEYRQLQGERTALAGLLARLPAESVIERMGLEARKREVEETLASQTAPSREPVRARLTFRGKPIVGSHGMFATFGATAVSTFEEAVAAIGASQARALGARGMLPNRDDYRLLITGTALGSFGFELEEAPKDGMALPAVSLVEPAIEQTEAIMEATVGTDDELTEAVADSDARALDKLRAFLQTLAEEEALCTLEFRDQVFRFADVGQVRRSEGRLSRDNIHEDRRQMEGVFQGVLPKKRTFEFRIVSSQEIIAGKVGADIPDAGAINHLLEQVTTIEVQVTRVGNGRPRYVLLRYEEPAGPAPGMEPNR